MSPTVTIKVPLVKNETVFLLNVIQAALIAYRKHHNKSDPQSEHLNNKESSKTTDADRITGSFGEPTSVVA